MPETGPPRAGSRIGVAVVEDHEILRRGLVASLAEDRSVEVTVANADAVSEPDIDIAVVSAEAARSHRFPCPIVVCSDHPEGPSGVEPGNDVAGMLHRGSLTVAQLHATVHAAAAGLRVHADVQGEGAGDAFDSRALRLIELIADGHSTREIADRMSYSERTIKKLITGLEQRMHARSRAQIVALAIRRGLI
jgi:DNA-binding NarL/FixJ family response regulator